MSVNRNPAGTVQNEQVPSTVIDLRRLLPPASVRRTYPLQPSHILVTQAIGVGLELRYDCRRLRLNALLFGVDVGELPE